MADENCAHTGCSCKIEQGKAVSKGGKNNCNDNCANPGTYGSSKCQCGHPACR